VRKVKVEVVKALVGRGDYKRAMAAILDLPESQRNLALEESAKVCLSYPGVSLAFAKLLPEPQRSKMLEIIREKCVEKGEVNVAKKTAEAQEKPLTGEEIKRMIEKNIKEEEYYSAIEAVELLEEPDAIKELKRLLKIVNKEKYDYYIAEVLSALISRNALTVDEIEDIIAEGITKGWTFSTLREIANSLPDPLKKQYLKILNSDP
jgi:hypothetical protein